MRKWRRRVSGKGCAFSESDRIRAIQAVGGPDVSSDINAVAEGKTIEPSSDALGSCVVRTRKLVTVFDPGFNVDESHRRRMFVGVDPDGPAYAAGLRDGQKWVKGV